MKKNISWERNNNGAEGYIDRWVFPHLSHSHCRQWANPMHANELEQPATTVIRTRARIDPARKVITLFHRLAENCIWFQASLPMAMTKTIAVMPVIGHGWKPCRNVSVKPRFWNGTNNEKLWNAGRRRSRQSSDTRLPFISSAKRSTSDWSPKQKNPV